MTLGVQIVLAAVLAGALGAFGPAVTGRLPEPDQPADGKMPYRAVAEVNGAAPIQAGLAAASAACIAWAVAQPELLGIWILLAGVGSWLAFIDWHTHYLPFRLTAPLYVGVWAAVLSAAALLGTTDVVVRAAIANVIVYVLFWILYLVGNRFSGGFGFGDVRLAVIVAVALAPLGGTAVLAGLYAGFVLGAVGAIILRRMKIMDGSTFAFGPYLLLGAVVGAAWVPLFA